jgi:hypothetical protein
MNDTIKKVDDMLQHIKKVESNCIKLGKKLIENGEINSGLKLIVLGRTHDLSKLDDSYEFEHLDKVSHEFDIALQRHRKQNKHHPEAWANINYMGSLYIAEMVCDCVARAQEFGTDIREWFENEATIKYGFSMQEWVGKEITKYLDLLLTPKFK